MPLLSYLPNDVFYGLVKDVLDIGRAKQVAAAKEFQKNVIDPFASLFDVAVSGIDHETWRQTELVRQCQKTLTNHIGNLHQKVLGNVEGWQDLGVGANVDLVCHDKKIIAEVKNKFNTVTGGKLADQYHSLERLVMPKASQYKDYTAYFVNVIPKKPQRYDLVFEPSDKETGNKCRANESIRIIDGASFYSLVTGKESALHDFYLALPVVIEEIFQNDYQEVDFCFPDKAEFERYFNAAYGSAAAQNQFDF